MNKFTRMMKAALTLMLLAVLFGGGWFYRFQEQTVRKAVETDLSTVVRLKARQITAWREERLGDAAVLQENPFFAESAARFLADPRDENTEGLRAHFRSLQKHYNYSDILLVNADGQVRLSLSGKTEPHSGYASALAAAFGDRKPVFSDLYTVEQNPTPLISAVAPLFDGDGQASKPFGAVILVCDASRFLYPLIQSWPTPTKTAETLLVRRDGDNVLFLNDLRHQSDTALKLRIPLSRSDVPAVMAVKGFQGVFEGKDYRGVEVLTIIQPVPDTPWFMVAKMDKAEAFAVWHFRSVLILLLIMGLVVVVVVLGLVVRQREKKNHYWALYRSESALRASLERNSITLKSIGDAVITTDAQGLVELLNPVAEALTGWKIVEARGKPLREVFRIINEQTRAEVENPVARVLREGIVVGLANHTLLIAKDGAEISIADSGAPIRNEEGEITGVVMVFRDQTADRAAQKALEDSERRYRRLFESARDGILILDADTGQVVDVNPFLLSLLGYSYEELSGKEIWEIGFFKDIAASQDVFRTLQEKEYIRYEDLPLETYDGRRIEVEFVSNVYLVDHTKVIQCNIRDITERKQAVDALRESEEFKNAILDSVPSHIAVLDTNGVIVSVNGPWVRFSVENGTSKGLPARHTGPGVNYLNVCRESFGEPSEGAMAAHDGILAVLEGTLPSLSLEYPCHSPGVERWFTMTVTPLGTGERGVVISHTNITERKQAEEELRKSEEQVQAFGKILELASLPFSMGYPDGRVGIFNRAFCDLTGYGEDELHAMDWSKDLTPAEWREPEAKALQELESTGNAVQYEKEYIRKNGTRVPVELLVHAERDTAGKIQFYYAFVTDISERKRVQQEMRKLSSAVEQSPVSVEITDFAGNIEYVNPKFTEITGYALEEVRGKNPRILKSGETPAEEYRDLWETVTAGGVWHGEFHNRKKDGTIFWERVSISPIHDASGATTHFVAVKEDITAQKILEDQFRQAQKMEAVGRLAGGVAHDFNNMLGIVMGYAELAKMRTSPNDPLYGELDQILQTVRSSAGLVRQLLAFARRQTVEPRVLDLNDVIAESEKMLRRLVGEDITVKFVPGNDLWNIKIDPAQVDQILANLTVNARDAIPGVGNISIETQNVIMDEAYCALHRGFIPGEYVVLTFSDSGMGMGKDVQEHIFEPFFTTKDTGKGTGLGLSTIYGIVKQNQGFISVYSEIGQGTTLTIYFPRYEGQAEEKELKTEPVALTGTETILVVEDERQILNLTQKILEKHGYRVIPAALPGEALALCEKHLDEIHLLISDVVMPTMNGKDLKERIEKLKPGIKVLFMSGYTANVIAHRGVLSEGIQFIQKPFTVEALVRKVREVLG